MGLTIPKAANRGEDGTYGWEKNIKDVNNVDENFANARDIGYLRLNYSRSSAVAKLSKFDSVDFYKIQLQSNGKLFLSLKSGEVDPDKKVLDLSKYEKQIDDLKKLTDPEGWADDQIKKTAEEKANLQKSVMEKNAPGLKVEVYMLDKRGKEVLIGDSGAEKGSKLFNTMEKILDGEYRANKGQYYIKVSRNDTVSQKDEVSYAMQLQMGKTFKHDYIVTEQISDDTKNKKESKVPSINSGGALSPLNVLQIQASRNQGAADMLAVGYLNMADIYNKNSQK